MTDEMKFCPKCGNLVCILKNSKSGSGPGGQYCGKSVQFYIDRTDQCKWFSKWICSYRKS